MDIGFVILCPENNLDNLKTSLLSIKNRCHNRDCIAVANSVENKDLCQVYKCDKSLASFVNTGMKRCKHDWAFLMFSGSRVQKYLEKQLATFALQETDVLFPANNYRPNFVDSPFNGILLNTNFFKKVGNFTTNTMEKEGVAEFDLAKLFWALDAIAMGARFKAIVGMKMI